MAVIMKKHVKILSLLVSAILLLSVFSVNSLAINNESVMYASGANDSANTLCTITYEANGGVVSPASETVLAGVAFDLPTPTREGYTFLGWTTNKDATTPDFGSGDSVIADGNVTVYALWQKNSETPKPDNPTKPDDSPNSEIPTISPDGEVDFAEIFSKIFDFVLKAVTWFVEFISSLIEN